MVRIFNTYGPCMRPDDGRVVSNFIVQALAGEALTVYGEGQQTRSFCYVDDLVDGLQRMMATDPSVTGPINLGNPEETTVRELADLVLQMTGGTGGVRFESLPVDDPRQRQPDITLAASTLGWQPTTPLEDGLKRTIEWFSEGP